MHDWVLPPWDVSIKDSLVGVIHSHKYRREWMVEVTGVIIIAIEIGVVVLPLVVELRIYFWSPDNYWRKITLVGGKDIRINEVAQRESKE